jgi:hypothetical protein
MVRADGWCGGKNWFEWNYMGAGLGWKQEIIVTIGWAILVIKDRRCKGDTTLGSDFARSSRETNPNDVCSNSPSPFQGAPMSSCRPASEEIQYRSVRRVRSVSSVDLHVNETIFSRAVWL